VLSPHCLGVPGGIPPAWGPTPIPPIEGGGWSAHPPLPEPMPYPVPDEESS
jgi:hypothetical protein